MKASVLIFGILYSLCGVVCSIFIDKITGISYLLFGMGDINSMDNLKFIFHVCKKTEFFKDVYVSKPYSNGDLCRDEANKKRAEYGKDYDVYYTTSFNNKHSQAKQGLNIKTTCPNFVIYS